MGVLLPELRLDDFVERLEAVAGDLPQAVGTALHLHYQELRRWAPRLSLVGPGTPERVVERHYAESLAALPWVSRGGCLVDVGSGAGFPGLVLGLAVPRLDVTLVESRQRKSAFLQAAVRTASQEVDTRQIQVLPVRLEAAVPSGFPERLDFVTIRAVRLSARAWRALLGRLKPSGLVLWWAGSSQPEVPGPLFLEKQVSLDGSRRRRLMVFSR